MRTDSTALSRPAAPLSSPAAMAACVIRSTGAGASVPGWLTWPTPTMTGERGSGGLTGANPSGGPGRAEASHVRAHALPGLLAVSGLRGWPQQVSSGPSALISTISLPQLSQRRRVPAFTSIRTFLSVAMIAAKDGRTVDQQIVSDPEPIRLGRSAQAFFAEALDGPERIIGSVARRQGLGRVELHDGAMACEPAAARLGAHDLSAAFAAGVALASLVALLVSHGLSLERAQPALVP